MTRKLLSWEALLLFILIVVVLINVNLSPFYLGLNNQINLFQLSIEKIIVALAMTLIIINAEIDLSVASVMGLAACTLAYLHAHEQPFVLSLAVSLLIGAAAGAFNGFWVAYAGLPSLVVTLAGLIGYRGLALVLLEDESIGGFPEWFNQVGQQGLMGSVPFSLLLFGLGVVVVWVVLQRSENGRYIYVIGNSADVARYSGVNVKRVKMALFVASGLVSALAGILLAARLGAVRGSTAQGFELDIITMVLLGGVSIFGGSGTLTGVVLSILIILNLRNGLSLVNISGNTQTGIIGLLLILSVLIPNWLASAQSWWARRQESAAQVSG
ncbi:MAG: ABC transporter permease [Ardenticatenaceae bacterium]|nr:ABC transporter permease [Ardenticatenaceae bacterium]